MAANRMNRDEFYVTMALSDEAGLRKVLWTLYWRGDARLRERIEDELQITPQPLPAPLRSRTVIHPAPQPPPRRRAWLPPLTT
jgi:hypothetical protein